MSSLSDAQKTFYEEALKQTRQEIQDIEDQIQEELARVKQKISDLHAGQKAAREMYDAAGQRLGIPNDLEEERSSS